MSRTLIIAHRGASHAHVENSMTAFRTALRDGADGLEVDLRRSSDGAIFCFHDHQLSRLTGKAGYFRRTAAARIDQLRLSDGSRIPPFSQFVKEFVGNSRVVLDIKSAHIEATILAELGELAGDGRLVYSSFNPNVVKRIKAELPDARTALIVGPVRNLQMRLRMKSLLAKRLKQLHCNAVHLSKLLVSEGLVRHLHGEGLSVSVWTVDDPKQARKLVDIGVDSIMTNEPAAILRALRGGE